MQEREIVEKLKLDIEDQERSYKKNLEIIKKEDNLLNYIKGMLDITQNSVINFPYYDGRNKDETEAEKNFNMMLKYTLKEDKIIASFKSEIKNLYYLEKIGYEHAEQYKEITKKLEEYRVKIAEAYNELIKNEALKQTTVKKEEMLNKIAIVKDYLKDQVEAENIDNFYEGLQYAHLSENEKTSILLFIFKKNLIIEKQKLENLSNVRSCLLERKIAKVKKENIDKIKASVKKLENQFSIKITYPTDKFQVSKRAEKNRFLFAEI